METIATGEPSARETDAVPAPLRSIEKDEEQPVMLPGGLLLRRRARALRLLRMRRDQDRGRGQHHLDPVASVCLR